MRAGRTNLPAARSRQLAGSACAVLAGVDWSGTSLSARRADLSWAEWRTQAQTQTQTQTQAQTQTQTRTQTHARGLRP